MGAVDWNERINVLPEDLKKQVEDFVEFLILKNKISDYDDGELTVAQKLELEKSWAEYEANPESAISLEDLKKETAKKYGI